MGDLVEAEGIVRDGLAATDHPNAEAIIRLQAGVLAVRTAPTTQRAARTRPEIRPHPRRAARVHGGGTIAEMLMAEDNP